LQAKKYDEARGIWQGRVNRGWRFYFKIEDDTFYLIDVMPHPK
jgi:plasmid maintenance system killer protein